ncbi:MAG: alpha/beta fold hydrolase [Alphaproteobacteria bacterium]
MNFLTLSGWTQPSDALARIIPDAAYFDYSDYPSPEASFAGLAPFANVSQVVAWSMGGQLALKAIQAGVLSPKKLTLIAVPYQFVADSRVKAAMDPVTFAQFRENYVHHPARSKTRFHGLIAKGDQHHARVMAALGHHQEVEHTSRWLPWLDALASDSFYGQDVSRIPPTLLIHGENDVIVPVAQSKHLANALPYARLKIWSDCGHAPHLHDPIAFHRLVQSHHDD